ncbi:SusF/SusE family outer membrane protein [Bacteroides sp. UBA939]|uniref:SusF/SusE family outer membrane protein n=1 Tax=Bacteroides sp. UBA939 TaxID=1946092 RepID=UPI0025C37C68|nr:SusF/SusE family outer membrane protein [Bacteroides sp. UBA939]
MKRYISHLVFALLGCMALSACVDNDYMELDKGHNELTLSIGNTGIVLNEQAHADDALELSWTTGTNYGTGNKISYTLEIAEAGTNFATPYIALENAVQEYTWKKSVEELNTILREHFGAEASESISLEARLTAKVVDREELQVATTSFSVTAYEPLTATLYLIGDATPGGWSADNAAEMTRKSNGIFTWTGRMTPGSFKFITTLGAFLPSYNKGTDGKLVLRTSDSQPDEPFTIEEEFNYTVDANLFTGVVTLAQTENLTPAYDQLYLVGNVTDWGFAPMKRDVLDAFLFRHAAFFEAAKGGEFKFGTSEGNWENMYKAKSANASYTDTEVEFVSGFDPDNKWLLKDGELDKAYKICVDIRTGSERMMMSEFVPYEMIYMIGDATPAGWTIGDATPMQATDNPYVFTWQGVLNAGELKFTCDKKDDWNGAWFMPTEADKQPTGEVEPMLFLDKASDAFKAQYLDVMVGGVDLKWRIPVAGSYIITLNQLEETIEIVKQ